MGLVLGTVGKRIELSKEALGVEIYTIEEEVNRYLDKRRLLGLNNPINRYEFYVQLSEKSYMMFEANTSCSSYYIKDDTDIIVDKHSNDVKVYAEVTNISLDLQKYADMKSRPDRGIFIYSGHNRIHFKLKAAYVARVRFYGIRTVYAELEGLKNAYNQIGFSKKHGKDTKLNIKKIENVLVYDEYQEGYGLEFSVTPEQAKEFAKICEGISAYKLEPNGIEHSKIVETRVAESEITAIRIYDAYRGGSNNCRIVWDKGAYLDIEPEKIANFMYEIQKSIKQMELCTWLGE